MPENCLCKKPILDCECLGVWFTGQVIKKKPKNVFFVFFSDLEEERKVAFDRESWILCDL